MACARPGFCRAMLERAISLLKNASSVFCKFSACAPGEKPRPGEVEVGSKEIRCVRSGDQARAAADGSPTSNRLPTTYCAVQRAGHKSLARVGQRESLGLAHNRRPSGAEEGGGRMSRPVRGRSSSPARSIDHFATLVPDTSPLVVPLPSSGSTVSRETTSVTSGTLNAASMAR